MSFMIVPCRHRIEADVWSIGFFLHPFCGRLLISLFVPNWFSLVPVRANASRRQSDSGLVAKLDGSCTCISCIGCIANKHHDSSDTNNCRSQSMVCRVGCKWNPNLENGNKERWLWFHSQSWQILISIDSIQYNNRCSQFWQIKFYSIFSHFVCAAKTFSDHSQSFGIFWFRFSI